MCSITQIGHIDLQSSVVAAKGLSNEVVLDKLLSLIGTQLQLETLS